MKKTQIESVIRGNVVNVSIGGKLHSKNCGSPEEAKELMRVVLTARDNPTEENINAIRAYLNEKLRVAFLTGLQSDPDTGSVFMSGFNTPLPNTLVEVLKDYHENNFPIDALMNFWKLLMINPDVRVRNDLFDFITTHDFSVTSKGYMVVYKAVNEKTTNAEATSFAEYVNRQYLYVKKNWSCSPKKYVVYRNLEDDVWEITKKKTAAKWDEKTRNVEILGNLAELHDSLFNAEQTDDTNVPLFESITSLGPKMEIRLGVPVKQARKDCDANPRQDCSNGLHVGATKYVETFGGSTKRVLVCYVNPAHVVAVPQYDHSKMRVCEYFPFAIADYDNNKIDVIEQSYFESDYCEYEEAELEKQVELLQANELPIEAAQNAEPEARPMSELRKIIAARMVDL